MSRIVPPARAARTAGGERITARAFGPFPCQMSTRRAFAVDWQWHERFPNERSSGERGIRARTGAAGATSGACPSSEASRRWRTLVCRPCDRGAASARGARPQRRIAARVNVRGGSRRSRLVAVPVKVSTRGRTFCRAPRSSIASAEPTTLTLPTHDLDAGAALADLQRRYPTAQVRIRKGFCPPLR